MNIALETKCEVIDLYNKMNEYPNYERLLSDGLHFEPMGYEFFSRLILDV